MPTKTSFPKDQLKDPNKLVNDNIIPLNNTFCNFILNVAPNRDGLIDENALQALKQIGKIWDNKGPVATLTHSLGQGLSIRRKIPSIGAVHFFWTISHRARVGCGRL